MHYSMLLEISGHWKTDGVYEKTIEDLQWPTSKVDKNMAILLDFLRSWHSLRRSVDPKTLARTWTNEVEPYARGLETLTLENSDLEIIIRAGNEQLHAAVAVEHMYGALVDIPGIDHTNASKLLHLRLPRLFVMTDQAVRLAFDKFGGLKFSPYSYAFSFLAQAKSAVNEAIDTLCADKHMSRQQGIRSLQDAHGRQRTLAKLIDECYVTLANESDKFPPNYMTIFTRR